MNIYIRCQACKNEINFITWKTNRYDLQLSKQDEIFLECKFCGQRKNYPVHKLKAEVSRIVHLISGLIFLFGTIGLGILAYLLIEETSPLVFITELISVLLIPSLIYGKILKVERKRVRSFNMS